MQRPNFQMIEDLPEKNYMRYVSQYKLDDMVRLFYVFMIFLHSYFVLCFISFIFSDGKIETSELRGNIVERYENETVESILFFKLNESW